MAWNPFSWWLQFGRFVTSAIEQDECEPEARGVLAESVDPADVNHDDGSDEEETDELEPAAVTGRTLRSVGAWTGSSSIKSTANMARDVALARGLGLRRLDVMINDHSAKRQPKDFDTYNKTKITEFCLRARDAGIAVHLTTWCMPHERYLRQMGSQLIDLVGATGAKSVMFDAEEPWVNAARPMPWGEAAELVAEVMQAIPFGVTGIGYASERKLGPLVERARYMVPQCYSTKGNKLDPRTAATRLSASWRKKFGDRELVVGLAGYAQEGRPSYTKDRFMRTAFDAAKAAGPTDIVYWSLAWIRGSRTTANIVQSLAAQAAADARVS